MDKYEFNIKVEQIKKLVNKGDYETAMKIADSVDWRRVRSTSLLTMIAQVYERNEEYQDAKDILLLAFERAPIGKGLLFKLTDLALREGNVPEAEAYYREFCELSSDDPRQNLLRYLILEAKKAPLEQLINSLERYCQDELDEKWLYRLAVLYQEAGRESDCVKICDRIMLMFGLGKYVDKAMELKLQYAPLTKYQMDLVENREKYEEKLKAVEEKFDKAKYRQSEQDYDDYEDGISDYDDADPSEDEIVAKLHEVEAEENLAREMSHIAPYDEEEGGAVGETRVIGNIRELKQRQRGGKAEFAERAVEDPSRPAVSERTAASESAATSENFPADPGEQVSGSVSLRVDANTIEDEETELEDWDLEPDETESNHLMIEAEDAAAGLNLALESLKKIHRELGSKNPVAKISGEKLNRKGIFAVSDRLSGKDLIVEKAADLNQATIGELCELMEQDNTGIIVVLIDTPERMERLHNAYPVLADKFQYIGCETAADTTRGISVDDGKSAGAWKKEAVQEETEAASRDPRVLKARLEKEAEVARKRLAEREEEIRRQAARDAEAARLRQSARQAEEDALLQEGTGIPDDEMQADYSGRTAGVQEGYDRYRTVPASDYRSGYDDNTEPSYHSEGYKAAADSNYWSDSYRERAEAGDRTGYEDSIDSGFRAGYQESGQYPYTAAHGGDEEPDYRTRYDESRGSDYRSGYSDEAAHQRRAGMGQDISGNRQAGYSEEDFERPAEYEVEEAVRIQAEYAADEARLQAAAEEDFEAPESLPGTGRGHGMDVEEFVQYACKYAAEIDCSISGKSMLALYERAEMMEEDGVALTNESAEDLIEEAADKAEKRSFGGLFSSKYDKDGLLILKEKHFFD